MPTSSPFRSLVFTVLATAATASAQTYVFAPDNAAATDPGVILGGLLGSSTGLRVQYIYDSSHFLTFGVNGPCTIQRMRFRAWANTPPGNGVSWVGDGSTTGYTVDIGTSATDYATPSTTFASNRGAMQNVMAFATLTVAPSPNPTLRNYVIDIPIPGGFAYDPTLGQDLLIDFKQTPTQLLGAFGLMATGSSLAASRCTRIDGSSTNATAGTISGGAAMVALFDISGPGGLPDDGNGFPVVEQATATPIGQGCPFASRAFGELFSAATPSLDLGTGIRMTPDVAGAPTRYTVTAATGSLRPIAGAVLQSNAVPPGAMTDDTMSQACSLGFSFPFAGGSTTVVHANTNGYIVLAPTAVTGGATLPTLGALTTAGASHAGLPRLLPVWYDLHATRNTSIDPTAGLYFETDTVTNRAWLTWNNVGEFATTTAGAKSYTFQVEMAADGTVEFRYGGMSTFGNGGPKVVGFSPGTTGVVPPSTDLSASLPLVTDAVDVAGPPLTLTVTPPRVGTAATFTTANVPPPGIVINWITVAGLPGVDLAGAGMPSCRAYVDLGGIILESVFYGVVGSLSNPVSVPNDPGLVGWTVRAQAGAIAPGLNAFGGATSNGVILHVGTVQ